MARPRKDSEEKGAETRMTEAFWDQLSRMPYREVTAASVARQAGCNRATFYYYFDSIEDLAEQAVDAAVPTGIADLAQKLLSESVTSFCLDENQRNAVERICLLTGPNGSTRLAERFKRALAETWASKFGLDPTQEDVRTVASFMASGIVGILGDQEGLPCDERFDARLQTISKVFSASAMRFARTTADASTHAAATSSATASDDALDCKLAENRDNWDDRAAVHAESAFYEVERLVSDPSYISGVARRDFEALSPYLPQASLAGLSVLHLQCHIGTDTISWLRLGAHEAWGLDFSPASLSHARRIAQRAGANATFVEGDARFASCLIDRTFDVVVTGTGAITWLPDLDNWARSIANLLVPGGAFLLRDDHPLLDALGYESLTVTEDYLSGTGSIDYESNESYVEGSAGRIAHTANHNWRHDFQEIVGSLLTAGLSVEALRESPYAEWRALPFLVETKRGWTMPEGMPKIPLSFAIIARKPREERMG
jgi:AcrR family transcriptional regulator